MKVLFLYPAVKNIPNGGLKNIYDYANRLVQDGINVTIAYAASFDSIDTTLKKRVKSVLKYIYLRLTIGKTGYTWYNKDHRIKECLIYTPKQNNLPEADAYIATAVCTAPYIHSLECNKVKLYYIQDYEKFIVNDDNFIKSTYRLSLHKIVISKWLQRIVRNQGQDSTLIPNGFDFNIFKLTIPIAKKDKYLVSMLYHINPRKDINTGLKAMELVKERIPQLKLVMFGAYEKPIWLKDWMTYYRTPSKEQHLMINNKAAIYVGCSQIEGWGLTIGEAMMCGQAVACTDNDGYLEMAVDGRNALVSHIGDSEALANNIVRLIEDDELRKNVAKKGYESIKAFDIEDSYKMFRNCIITDIEENEGKHHNDKL